MPETASSVAIAPAKPATSRVKILLVDDSEENLMALEAVLETLGEQLVLARSGTEALRQVLDQDFAAILLDVKMPDMDGFETAQLIRSRKRSRDTPILFLTGYHSDEHLLRGYNLGAADFLFKPFVPEILRSKVSVFIELARNSQIQRQQAEVLRKAEQKFRALLEAAPIAMIISHEDGEIVLVNSRVETVFGQAREDLIGANVRQLLPDWRAPVNHDSPLAVAEAFILREMIALKNDGGFFPAGVNFSPLQTEEGLLITTAIRDITEVKRAEESIRRLNQDLERRVSERTSELRRINEQLRQFAYAISHDLREPLRMVVSYTQLLGQRYRERLDEHAQQIMDFAVEGAMRIDTLLRALHECLQVEGGREQPLELVDCDAVLGRSLENLASTIDAAGAAVTRDPLPSVWCHAVLLARVFQNLVENAIKYRRDGVTPGVHLSAERKSGEWIFSVRDNGIGMEPQHLERIFGLFKRLHGRRYPGAGIGLTLCAKIVEQYGGRIWAESALGQGSTFRFSIPDYEERPR